MDDFEAAIAAKLAPVEGTTGEEKEPEAASEQEAPEAVEEAAVETEGEEQDDQPRDEKGRFVPKDERPEWLPEKFKDPADLARAYSELESRFGSQSQEIGELRRLAEQIAGEQQQARQPHVGQLQAALEENPEAVAYWAAQQGNEQVLDQALVAWHQRAMDEGDAASLVSAQKFAQELTIARLKHEFSQEVTPSIEQMQNEASKRALTLAHRELQQKYQDFAQIIESVTEQDVAGLDPNVLSELQKRDPKAALEMVYRWVAAERRMAAVQQEDTSREESLQRKREATVASSSSTPAAREKSNVEQFKELILQPEAHAIRHGLTRE